MGRMQKGKNLALIPHVLYMSLINDIRVVRLHLIIFMEDTLNELAQYLIENIILDFEGDVTTETVRAFLRKDESPQARALLQRIIEEQGIDELLLALADCLTAELAKRFTPSDVTEHLITYSEA